MSCSCRKAISRVAAKKIVFDEIKKDVEVVLPYYKNIDKIFLADGNALIIPTDELIKILKLLCYCEFKKPFLVWMQMIGEEEEDGKTSREDGRD